MDPNALKIALAPVIMGLVEAAKQAGLPTRWLPLLSMALGVVGGPLIGLVYGSTNLGIDVLTGFGVGAAATGLYAAVSTIGGDVNVSTHTDAMATRPLPGGPA